MEQVTDTSYSDGESNDIASTSQAFMEEGAPSMAINASSVASDLSSSSPEDVGVSSASEVPSMTIADAAVFDGAAGGEVVTDIAHESKWWSEEAQLGFLSSTVKCARKKGLNLWMPIILAEMPDAEVVYDTVTSLILRGCDVIMTSSWIIGSTTADILGKPRSDSQSHIQGRAVDVSPMYAADVILPPDPACMGLAWNFASLAAISTLVWGDKRSCFFVVEGDHLHIMLDVPQEATPGEVFVFMTMSSAYPNVKKNGGVFPLSVLKNQFFRMSALDVSFSLGSEADNSRILELLK